MAFFHFSLKVKVIQKGKGAPADANFNQHSSNLTAIDL